MQLADLTDHYIIVFVGLIHVIVYYEQHLEIKTFSLDNLKLHFELASITIIFLYILSTSAIFFKQKHLIKLLYYFGQITCVRFS